MYNYSYMWEIKKGYEVEAGICENKGKIPDVLKLKADKPFIIYAVTEVVDDNQGELYICNWGRKKKSFIREAGKELLSRLKDFYQNQFLIASDYDDPPEITAHLLKVHIEDVYNCGGDKRINIKKYRENWARFERMSDQELREEGDLWWEGAPFIYNGYVKIYHQEKLQEMKRYDFMAASLLIKEGKNINIITTRECELGVIQKMLYFLMEAAVEYGEDREEIMQEWMDFIAR